MPGFLKCNCEHCGGRIEYPAEAVGANVACPHCQQETPLKVESAGEDPEVVTVGGGKAKLVLGTVAACLVAVAALVAAGIWVKQRGTVKDSANAKPGPKTAGTPTPGAAGATGGAKVELDPPKVVVPVVGKFQNGLSAAQIKSGRAIIAGPCTDCHRQYDPATYNGEEWSRIIGSMRGKAKLRGRESDDLDTFVRSVKN